MYFPSPEVGTVKTKLNIVPFVCCLFSPYTDALTNLQIKSSSKSVQVGNREMVNVTCDGRYVGVAIHFESSSPQKERPFMRTIVILHVRVDEKILWPFLSVIIPRKLYRFSSNLVSRCQLKITSLWWQFVKSVSGEQQWCLNFFTRYFDRILYTNLKYCQTVQPLFWLKLQILVDWKGLFQWNFANTNS